MKHINKGLLVLLSLMMITGACGNKKKTTGTDLKTRRKIIKKQLDSLKKELVRIERKLRDTLDEDIPFISVDTVAVRDFIYYIDLQGTVKSDGDVTVVPSFQGEVMKIYKKVGDKVKKGDVLMRIDDKILRNQIAEVRTQYSLAKTAYERQKRLWEQKIGSEMAYLQAKTQYLALQKKLATLNEQLKKAKVTAPVSGTLDDLMIKEGETAMPGRPVARIVNLKKVYVDADVSEKYLKEMRKGRPVKLFFPEAGLEKKARLDYVGNFIHPNNRTFKIRINLDNPEGLLKPNLTARIKVLGEKIDSVVVIPVSLVQEDAQGKPYVYILEFMKKNPEGKPVYRVKKAMVEKGKIYDKQIWIKKGLKQGDLLALSGAYGLTEGDQVYIKSEKNE
jgi:RND family efflux transporter MFP subunit